MKNTPESPTRYTALKGRETIRPKSVPNFHPFEGPSCYRPARSCVRTFQIAGIAISSTRPLNSCWQVSCYSHYTQMQTTHTVCAIQIAPVSFYQALFSLRFETHTNSPCCLLTFHSSKESLTPLTTSESPNNPYHRPIVARAYSVCKWTSRNVAYRRRTLPFSIRETNKLHILCS